MANEDKIEDDELIDETSVESFPASDAPSWTMGKAPDAEQSPPSPPPPIPLGKDAVNKTADARPQKSKEKPRA